MFAFVFILAAIGLSAYSRSTNTPLETACWWFCILLGAFLVLCTGFHKLGELRLSRRFDELYSNYNTQFGNTSSGRQFLDGVQPWHQRLHSSLGLLSLFGDWHVVLASRVAVAVAEHFSGKTPEQRTLEDEIRSIAQTAVTRRKQFSRTVFLTPIAIIAIGTATQTEFLPPPIGRMVVTTPTQPPAQVAIAPRTELSPLTVRRLAASTPGGYNTADEAQRIAIQRYPALGVAGSKLNTEFVTRYKLYQKTSPEYFRDMSWPIRLADELTQTPPLK